jgi:microcystin-dependent protein
MYEAFIGSIVLFAGNYAPKGWAFCNGQIMPIAQYQAVFSLLGTTYGGDGRITFALPDLQGRVPAHSGQGAGLQPIGLGEKIGTNTNTLTVGQMPMHSHAVIANATAAGRNLQALPTNNFPAQNQDASGNYATTADVQMNPATIGVTGANQAVNNMQPTLGLNYIICLEGIYPPRD